ncbi:predicted protein [Lichtheimia corymbifera JMRC:FSU:9682]|uniref:Uncharacterized protein n=1 Tax=Lichtheimia corymbifera JMRC:FSU:9682 TaxID=1263082 RepID=A0A068RX65_9FUNG|nr:predicted protein [Lichtheimia corymbifera JMRC:FSU:9682]
MLPCIIPIALIWRTSIYVIRYDAGGPGTSSSKASSIFSRYDYGRASWSSGLIPLSWDFAFITLGEILQQQIARNLCIMQQAFGDIQAYRIMKKGWMVHVIWGEGWYRAYLLLQLLYVFLARNRFHGVLSVYNQQFYHNPSMGSRWTYRFASRHFNHHLLFIIAQGNLTTMTFWVMLSSQLQLHGIKKNVRFYNGDMIQPLKSTWTRIAKRTLDERIPIAWMWILETVPTGIHWNTDLINHPTCLLDETDVTISWWEWTR